MSSIRIILEGDGAWPDLLRRPAPIHVTKEWQLAALAGGMSSGLPSVALRLDLPDGRVVVAETSLRMLVVAVRTFVAKYGDPTADADPEHALCPHCGQIGADPDVRDLGERGGTGWISVGFKCTSCGHVWGHEQLPPA